MVLSWEPIIGRIGSVRVRYAAKMADSVEVLVSWSVIDGNCNNAMPWNCGMNGILCVWNSL